MFASYKEYIGKDNLYLFFAHKEGGNGLVDPYSDQE